MDALAAGAMELSDPNAQHEQKTTKLVQEMKKMDINQPSKPGELKHNNYCLSISIYLVCMSYSHFSYVINLIHNQNKVYSTRSCRSRNLYASRLNHLIKNYL